MARALGRYELLRPLARGGMADVYLARRRAAGIEKWLVVKRMRPERTGDPRFLDLFVREARLSMSLAHQNIVPVFDFGRIDDQVFLAMERVEGKDLGSSLARATGHCLPPLLAAFVAAECCQALDYAHQRKSPDGVALGIVHRDVTPRNVLLSWSGEVKLTDFGIAALAGDATSRLLGTPQYMAPEQARSEPIDPRADIYAVGMVLREALTGVRPRPGSDRDAILEAARRGELLPWQPAVASPADGGTPAPGPGDRGEPARGPREDPPPALVAIVERATAATATDRYLDARTMLEDLDAFIVTQRAAHKAESPARQLAAWLAAVWADARDDSEADAAIEAGHLVSFLDDGAIDVAGTGTVRSLAATAAEEAHRDPVAAPPVDAAPPSAGPAGAGEPVASASPDPAIAPSPLALPDGLARKSRISSATSTVASGSFHAIPARSDRRSGNQGEGRSGHHGAASTDVRGQRQSEPSAERATPPRSRRAVSPVWRLVLVAVAAGASVYWVMSSLQDRSAAGTDTPGPARAAAPGTGAPGTGPGDGPPRPDRVPSAPAGSAAPGPAPAPGAPEPDPSSTGAAGTRAMQRRDGSSGDARAAADRRSPGHASAGAAAGTGTPHPTAHGAGASGPSDSPATGSGELAAPVAAPPPDAPATCRVRFNLTPWAYYTADNDSTQHETPGTIELTPGRHRLHVWNPELHVERDIVLDVPADRDTMTYSEPLQPSSLVPDAARGR